MAKKPRWSKVYRPEGWETIRRLSDNPLALKLYAFLCSTCDHMNAVVVSVDLLSEELGCSVRSVRRAAKHLEESDHLTIAKIGTANCYMGQKAQTRGNVR